MRDEELPQHLARLHAAHCVGDLVEVEVPRTDRSALILEGAGFARARAHQGKQRLRRLYTLSDRVAPDMRLLVVGLNPSPASAESGVGFHRPGNRFWPAMLAAGAATIDRDPDHLLVEHRIGMTDIVKRTTRRADEVAKDEFATGMERLTKLVEWLEPSRLLFVGLQGWRATLDRKAQRGWQDQDIGGRPVYLMPSTSGLNAHDTVDTLTEHIARAVEGTP